jgi:hypothetical protein
MKSLVGDYREEHLFTLDQSLQSYRHYQHLIEAVDHQVKRMMQQLPSKVADGEKPLKEKNPRKPPWRNEPPSLRDDLYRAFGVDLTQVPGINTLTAQMLLTEVGPDLCRFPTAATFCGCGSARTRKSAAAKYCRRRLAPTKNRACPNPLPPNYDSARKRRIHFPRARAPHAGPKEIKTARSGQGTRISISPRTDCSLGALASASPAIAYGESLAGNRQPPLNQGMGNFLPTIWRIFRRR